MSYVLSFSNVFAVTVHSHMGINNKCWLSEVPSNNSLDFYMSLFPGMQVRQVSGCDFSVGSEVLLQESPSCPCVPSEYRSTPVGAAQALAALSWQAPEPNLWTIPSDNPTSDWGCVLLAWDLLPAIVMLEAELPEEADSSSWWNSTKPGGRLAFQSSTGVSGGACYPCSRLGAFYSMWNCILFSLITNWMIEVVWLLFVQLSVR